MTAQEIAYLLLGAALVVALAVITAYYFSRKRKDKVERPKYRMLDDDE